MADVGYAPGARRAAGASFVPGDAQACYMAVLEASLDAILVVHEAGAIVSANPAAERLFGYPAGEAIGVAICKLLPEAQNTAQIGALARRPALGVRRLAGVDREVFGCNRAGDSFPVELSSTEWAAGGQSFRTLVLRDISDRVRAEDLQRLLLGELNHRVKNSLATVRALVTQTLRGAVDLEAARLTLDERLMALSRAHDVLTREKWEGAGLADIIAAAIEASGAPKRFNIASADLRLRPRLALAMSLTLHELCTNAVKYGALSRADGEVDIQIWRDDETLRLIWRERGGPVVTPPTRRGFGTRMIERLVSDARGETRLAFEPTGLTCTLTAPISSWNGWD